MTSAHDTNVSKILKLDFNESQFGTSPLAVKAMQEASATSNLYPEPFSATLRAKLGEKYGFGDEGQKHVVAHAGASGIISILRSAFLSPGDEVVTCVPTFEAYAGVARAAGAKLVSLPVTKDQTFDLDAMAAAITDKTRLVCICNPNNPTATVLERDAMLSFVKSLPPRVITVVDEAYIELADDPDALTMLPAVHEGLPVVVVRTFSKLYGMAGARVGYAVSTEELTESLSDVLPVFAVSRAAQAGAVAALEDDAFAVATRKAVAESRAFVTSELTKLGWDVYPSQTNFVYADSHLNTAALAAALRERGILIRGNYEFSRITLGTLEQDRRLVDTIRDVVGKGEVPARAAE